MNSLREAASKMGLNNQPVSALTMAYLVGMTPGFPPGSPAIYPPGITAPGGLRARPPVSLRQMMTILGSRPTPVEEVKFRKQILTPTGTALGGFVEVTLRSDGTYKAHFHLHDSGAADYKYQARAIFTASNGVAFALQQSGDVEGTSLNPFNPPRRDDDHDIEGSHPFIKQFWPDVKAGRLNVSKEYSPTGVIGVIQDIASVVLNIASHVAGAALGVVIGLGAEMGKVFGNLGLGAGFGLLAGVAVFASGGALVLALPVGVAVGAVTNALIKQRQINAQEMALAARIFGGSLPPANKIWLTNLAGIGDRAFTMPGVGNGDIYLNLGDAFNNPLGTARSYPKQGQLLIHELTHAWQIQHNTFLPGLVCSSVVNQARNEFGGSAYAYGASGPAWSNFNLEQQASIVDDYYARNAQADTRGMITFNDDPNDSYFRYIRDNIRPGRT